MNIDFLTRLALSAVIALPAHSALAELYQSPLAGNKSGPPVVLLTMQRDHRLFLEAYDDYSDINGDGIIDTKYKPNLVNAISGSSMDYYGYFDSYMCYAYGTKLVRNASTTTSTSNSIFYPVQRTRSGTKKCSPDDNTQSSYWSGDFLNYVTTTRIDALRKVFFGGTRFVDNTYKASGNNKTYGETVLERVYLPEDLHSFGKEYVSISEDGYNISDYAPLPEPAAGKRHLFANMSVTAAPADPLLLILKNSANRIWEWTAGESYSSSKNPKSFLGTPSEYIVRVQVCANDFLPAQGADFDYCKPYNSTHSKPEGILHKYGADDSALFGLLTGSYTNNFSGGVLRKGIGSFKNEVNATSGQFSTTVKGIVYTLNNLKITGYNYGYTNDNWWGNPIAEMMYEGYRYFAGKTSATTAYVTGISDQNDLTLPLPLVTSWTANSAFSQANMCSKPIQMLVSDVTPTFDSDDIPGSEFASTVASDIGNFSAATSSNAVWTAEGLGTKSLFIGEKKGAGEANMPTAKSGVSGFSDIRGLTPEDPSMQGSYYSAGIAKFAKETDLGSLNAVVASGKTVNTVAVALSAGIPKISFKAKNAAGDERVVTVIPYGIHDTSNAATSDAGWKENRAARLFVANMINVPGGKQNPAFNNGEPYLKLRVIFDDGEFGRSTDNDQDINAIYEVYSNSGKVTVNVCTDPNSANGTNLPSGYPKCDLDGDVPQGAATAGWMSHIGYVIDGVEVPGTEKFVRMVTRSVSGWSGSKSDKRHSLDLASSVVTNGNFSDDGYNGNLFMENYSASATNPSMRFNFGETLNISSASGSGGGEFVPHDPLWYVAKYGGYLDNNNNRQLDSGDIWVGADGKTPRSYYRVTNPSLLKEQIDQAIANEIPKPGVGAPVVADAVSTKQLKRIYQGRYSTEYWSGQFLAYDIDSATGAITGPVWDAGQRLPAAADRNIFSYRFSEASPTGIVMAWSGSGALDAVEKGYFSNSSALLDYFRGARTNEGTAATNYRKRDPVTVLGDMINSAPSMVLAEPQGFAALPVASGGGATYVSYLTTKATRPKVVYVGANDGMLHAFNAKELASNEGVELFAYVPRTALQNSPNVTTLANKAYAHRYFVDGPVVTSDYFDGSKWMTVVVGTQGAGGKSIFALDVSNPENFSASNILWEFTHPELGYVRSEPVIRRLSNGEWYVIVANGYESDTCDNSASPRYSVQTTGDPSPGQPKCTDILDSGGAAITVRNAKLFLIKLSPKLTDGWTANDDYFVIHATDVQTATVPPSVVSGVPSNGTDNGLTGVTTIVDSAGKDMAYGGDLQGNLWKFDLQNKVVISYAGGPLFVATNSAGQPIPITTAPMVNANPEDPAHKQYCVSFGTGRYVYQSDLKDKSVQSLFGIVDEGGVMAISGRAALQEQTIIGDGVLQDGRPYRVTSSTAVTTGQQGWFMDLKFAPSVNPREVGERLVYPAKQTLTRAGKLYATFNTLIPSGDDCESTSAAPAPFDVLSCSGAAFVDESLAPAQTVTIGGATYKVNGIGWQPKCAGSSCPPDPACPGPTVIKGCVFDLHVYSCASGPVSIKKPPSHTACSVSRTSWRQIR